MPKPISTLVALALAAGLLVAMPAPASAVNGPIVYSSGRLATGEAGLPEIWSVDPVGGTAQNLSRSPEAVDVDPAWDSAGGRIAFARQDDDSEIFELFTMNADGTKRSRVRIGGGANNRQPDWSPAGQIAFVRSSRAADTSHIYVVGADASGLTQLTETAAPAYDAAPVWSPTGTQIAFVSDRSGSPQLYVMDSGGTTETQLTFDPCFASNPTWKPDGSEIVYERQCPAAGGDIYRVAPTAPATGAPLVADATSDHQPSYAPDGDAIVFTRIQPNGDKDLFTVPAEGGTATALASNAPQADMSADWGAGVAAPRQSPFAAAVERETAEPREPRAPGENRKKKKRKRRPRKFKVVPGVRYSRFRREGSDVHMLKVNTDGQVTLDPTLSNDRLAGHERTSRMAKRNGAVAAINGDFGLPSNGRTLHTFAEDGDLKQLSFAVAWNFAITHDEQETFVGRPREIVTAFESDAWRVERWNFGEPAANEVAAFTPAGAGLEVPPGNSCQAKLSPVAGPRWAPGMTGIETPYRVDAVGCNTAPMAVGTGLVLAAQPGSDGAITLQSLAIGEQVEITWTLGWNGVAETVGGTPLLVDNGNVVATDCPTSLCRHNPRTAIGVTSRGRVLLVVIDGRSERSDGVTMVELGQIMKSLHARFALNLDGGGSSTMVVKGKVMNDPSDGKERKVSSAVLVRGGPDSEEQIGATARVAPRASGGGRAGDAALLDPGSTGGLLEAMAAGSLGPPVRLPAELRQALRAFRSSR